MKNPWNDPLNSKKWVETDPEPFVAESCTHTVSGSVTIFPEHTSTLIRVIATKVGEGSGKGCGGGCSGGTCNTPGSGEGPWMSSVRWSVSLGALEGGEPAGKIRLHEETITAASYTPAALQYTAPGPGVDVVLDSSGNLRQVLAQQALADVVTISALKYQIDFYHLTGLTQNLNGTWSTSGNPFVTWIIEDPDAGTGSNGRLLITEQRGSWSRETEFSYNATNDVWVMTEGAAGLRKTTLAKSVLSNGDRRHTVTVEDDLQMIAVQYHETFHDFPWGERIVERVDDPNGVALTTTYAYYESEQADGDNYTHLKQVTHPSGYWEKYEYDADGVLTKTIAQFLDSLASDTSENSHRVTEVFYTAEDLDSDQADDLIVTTVERLLGHEIARSYRISWSGIVSTGNYQRKSLIRTRTAGAAWNATDNLVTETRYYHGGDWHGKVRTVVHPDQTVTHHTYSRDSVTGELTTTTVRGLVDSGGAPFEGETTVEVTDRLGNLLSRDVYDAISTYYHLDSLIVTATDAFGRATRTDFPLRGTFETRSFSDCGCGVGTATDQEGITTMYGYDPLGRLFQTTRSGVTTRYALDAAGRRRSTTRIGSDSSEIVQNVSVFNPAGQLVSSTDAVNEITTFVESVDSLTGLSVRTITYPDLEQRMEKRYPDGSLESVSGAAALPLKYVYGVDTPDSLWGVNYSYVRTIRVGEGVDPEAEWEKTYRDMLGRSFRTVRPTPTGNAGEYRIFNNKGQLERLYRGPASETTGTEVHQTLFSYDWLGALVDTAIDVNQNALIDLGGNDRVTRTTTVSAERGSDIVRKTTTAVWTTDASSSATEDVSVVETAVSGLVRWETQHGLTTKVETSYDGLGGRTTTTTRPDNSYLVHVYQNGRLQSVTERNAAGTQLTKKSYVYDTHGRLRDEIDAANGTTVYEYYADDRLKKVTTPQPAWNQSALVTTYVYDERGRLAETIHPDLASTYAIYFPWGGLEKQWGTRKFPVEYTYSPQGRMKTMKTWKEFDQVTGVGISGSAKTTWKYHATTGLLKEKIDADAKVVSYSHDRLGRLSQRTWARWSETNYGYNTAGDLATLTYWDGTPNVSFQYDRVGHRKQVTDGFGTREIDHATDGRLLFEEGPALTGIDSHYTYDTLARLQKLEVKHQGTQTVAFEQEYAYQAGSPRLSSVKQGGFTATYSYKANSRLVSQYVATSHYGMTDRDKIDRVQASSIYDSWIVDWFDHRGYTYNAAGQREKVTTPALGANWGNPEAGNYWLYDYDPLGQVTDAERYWSDNTLVVGQQYGYLFDDIGNRTSTTVNSRTSTYTPDTAGVNEYASRTVPGAVDVLGLAGEATNDIEVNSTPAQHRKGRYFYHEVTSSNGSADTYEQIVVEEYDPLGPLVGSSTGYAFLPATPEAFVYDDDGNLTSDGRWSYTWDSENRLTQMETKSTLSSAVPHKRLKFKYDYMGRRLQKEIYDWNPSTGVFELSEERRFHYDGWNLVAELDGQKDLLKSYLWGLDLSGTLQGAGGVGGLRAITVYGLTTDVYEPYHDGNGNVIGMIALGAIYSDEPAARYDYDAFGNLIRATGPAAAINPFLFSTKYMDYETGLYYYGYRYYSPSMGRWLNRDPINEPGSMLVRGDKKYNRDEDLSLYAVVGNDPVNSFDPLGLQQFVSDQCQRLNELPFNKTWCEISRKCCEDEVRKGALECFGLLAGSEGKSLGVCIVGCVATGVLWKPCVAGCAGLSTIAHVLCMPTCHRAVRTAAEGCIDSYNRCMDKAPD